MFNVLLVRTTSGREPTVFVCNVVVVVVIWNQSLSGAKVSEG